MQASQAVHNHFIRREQGDPQDFLWTQAAISLSRISGGLVRSDTDAPHSCPLHCRIFVNSSHSCVTVALPSRTCMNPLHSLDTIHKISVRSNSTRKAS